MNCPECKTKKFINYKNSMYVCTKCEKIFSIKEIELDWRTKVILIDVVKKSIRKKKETKEQL